MGRYSALVGWSACQSAQSLSTNAWCSQNTGSFGETLVSIWPQTQVCTRLCMLMYPAEPSSVERKPAEPSRKGGESYVGMARAASTSDRGGSVGTR